ncbi:MAG: superoxide dismutase, Ni [Dehalococcoidia bacterium]|nr:superoxide dismutase, Ni [Dehalococcoidia bacterium]
MSNVLGKSLARLLAPRRVAHAHCDIPCGIYDPHAAQLAANTVATMVQKIQGLAPDDHNNLIRMVKVKEDHAEIVKREVVIIWGDYFKPEHLDKYPDLHDQTWKILKLASRNKQNIDAQAAQELQAAVDQFANVFWESKGQPAPAR